MKGQLLALHPGQPAQLRQLWSRIVPGPACWVSWGHQLFLAALPLRTLTRVETAVGWGGCPRPPGPSCVLKGSEGEGQASCWELGDPRIPLPPHSLHSLKEGHSLCPQAWHLHRALGTSSQRVIGVRWPPRVWGHMSAEGLGAQAWPSCSLALSPPTGVQCFFLQPSSLSRGVGGSHLSFLPDPRTLSSLPLFHLHICSEMARASPAPSSPQGYQVPLCAWLCTCRASFLLQAEPGEVGILTPFSGWDLEGPFTCHVVVMEVWAGARSQTLPYHAHVPGSLYVCGGNKNTEAFQSSVPWSLPLKSQRFRLMLSHGLTQAPTHLSNSRTRSGHIPMEQLPPTSAPTPIPPVCIPSIALTTCVPAAPPAPLTSSLLCPGTPPGLHTSSPLVSLPLAVVSGRRVSPPGSVGLLLAGILPGPVPNCGSLQYVAHAL